MSRLAVITATRGLPDGSAFVPWRFTATLAGDPVPGTQEGSLDGGTTWQPWQVLVDSCEAHCVCGGRGYGGYDGTTNGAGALDICEHCANGKARRAARHSHRNHRTLLKCRECVPGKCPSCWQADGPCLRPASEGGDCPCGCCGAGH